MRDHTICATCRHYTLQDVPEHLREQGDGICRDFNPLINHYVRWDRKACRAHRNAPNLAARNDYIKNMETQDAEKTAAEAPPA